VYGAGILFQMGTHTCPVNCVRRRYTVSNGDTHLSSFAEATLEHPLLTLANTAVRDILGILFELCIIIIIIKVGNLYSDVMSLAFR